MNPSPPPKRPFIQLLLLGFLLVVFPLGSFLYLRAGWNYQLDSWNEIEPLGPITDLVRYSRPDSTIDVVFLAPQTRNDSTALAIREIHRAFDDNPAIRFVALGSPDVFVFDDPSQLARVELPAAELERLSRTTIYTQACASIPLNQRAYVVDGAGQVRRCYNLHRGKEAARLVEQVALLMPRPKTEDVILERKTEL